MRGAARTSAAPWLALFLAGSTLAGQPSTPTPTPPAWVEMDPAERERRTSEVRAKVGPTYEIEVYGPWIYASNLEHYEGQRVLESIVRGAAVHLQLNLFTKKKPAKPVVIYLLRNMQSYYSASQKLLSEPEPYTGLGFYDRKGSYIFTHADLGYGALLHEMVHVMAEADFPEIPPWLNEGMGSLFEEFESKDGKPLGIPNWRLKRFKEESRERKFTPLADLLKMSYAEFYGARIMSNYAAVRFLMLWLQENNHAEALYRHMRDNKILDGAAALQTITGKSLDTIEHEYREWALTLRFQPSAPKRTTRDGFRR